MASRTKYDISHRTDGTWQVKQQDAARASGVFGRKDDAVERGRELARSQELGQLFIRGINGKIQTEHTYGKDPFQPKGSRARVTTAPQRSGIARSEKS